MAKEVVKENKLYMIHAELPGSSATSFTGDAFKVAEIIRDVERLHENQENCKLGIRVFEIPSWKEVSKSDIKLF